MTAGSALRASAVIDLATMAANLRTVRDRCSSGDVMVVVKADAYGHGMVPVARYLRGCGVAWLGLALPSEALALRAAGDEGRLLAWLWTPGDTDVSTCIDQGIDLSVSSDWALREIVQAAQQVRRTARIHLKADTGLTRNGVPWEQWHDLVREARVAEQAGDVEVVGIWSHLADGEVTGSASVAEQRQAFQRALEAAEQAGLQPRIRHLGNSGTAWTQTDWTDELIRSGIAVYGLTPGAQLGTVQDLGIKPAMTLRARLAHVKRVPAGTRVSYGGVWEAQRPTCVGLVPVGYADGIPRAAGGLIDVAVSGRRVPIVGRVAMDQFVIDLGPDATERAGDEVVLFGPGDQGELTADEWADRLGSIGYEVITRIGPRVPREYREGGVPWLST